LPRSRTRRSRKFVWLTIDKGGTYTNFKPLRGFVGQLLVEYGTHTLSILERDTNEEIASRIVTVGPDQRARRVRMSVPDK
jgi:hypothetical protein